MTERLSPCAVDTAGAADGDVFTYNATTNAYEAAAPVSGGVDSVVAGANVTVDNTDPANPVVSATGGGGGSGGVLTTKVHNPGTIASYTTTSTTEVDVDATNLVVSFTFPASGKVNVTLSALGGVNGTSGVAYWCLRSGSSVVTGSVTQVTSFNTASNMVFTVKLQVSGTAGAAATYKWGWKVSGTSPTARAFAGGVAGQAFMEVQAA